MIFKLVYTPIHEGAMCNAQTHFLLIAGLHVEPWVWGVNSKGTVVKVPHWP